MSKKTKKQTDYKSRFYLGVSTLVLVIIVFGVIFYLILRDQSDDNFAKSESQVQIGTEGLSGEMAVAPIAEGGSEVIKVKDYQSEFKEDVNFEVSYPASWYFIEHEVGDLRQVAFTSDQTDTTGEIRITIYPIRKDELIEDTYGRYHGINIFAASRRVKKTTIDDQEALELSSLDRGTIKSTAVIVNYGDYLYEIEDRKQTHLNDDIFEGFIQSFQRK